MKGNAKSEPGVLGFIHEGEKAGGRRQGTAGEALKQLSDGELYIFSMAQG